MILLLIALRFTYIHKRDKWTAAAERISLTLPHLIRVLFLSHSLAVGTFFMNISQKKNLFLHVFSSHNFKLIFSIRLRSLLDWLNLFNSTHVHIKKQLLNFSSNLSHSMGAVRVALFVVTSLFFLSSQDMKVMAEINLKIILLF